MSIHALCLITVVKHPWVVKTETMQNNLCLGFIYFTSDFTTKHVLYSHPSFSFLALYRIDVAGVNPKAHRVKTGSTP